MTGSCHYKTLVQRPPCYMYMYSKSRLETYNSSACVVLIVCYESNIYIFRYSSNYIQYGNESSSYEKNRVKHFRLAKLSETESRVLEHVRASVSAPRSTTQLQGYTVTASTLLFFTSGIYYKNIL